MRPRGRKIRRAPSTGDKCTRGEALVETPARRGGAVREGKRAFAVVVLVAWIAACSGGDDDPLARASGPSMQPPDHRQETVSSDSTANQDAPQIQSVRFHPASPTVGETVNAQVSVSATDSDRVRFDFSWAVEGTRQNERGPQLALHRARKGDSIDVRVRRANPSKPPPRCEIAPRTSSRSLSNRRETSRRAARSPRTRSVHTTSMETRSRSDTPGV